MNSTCETIIDLRNTTNLSRFLYQPFEKILFTTVWPCVIFLGLTGNILFIWTVKCVSSLHTSTYIFLGSLACTDIGLLISLGTKFITDVVRNPVRYGEVSIGTVITGITGFFCLTCSFCFVSFASLERYLSVCHPIRHHLLKGHKRTLKLVSITLLICLSVSLASVFYFGEFSIACVLWPEDLELLHYPKTINLSAFNQLSNSINVQTGDIFIASVLVLVAIINCFFYIRIVQDLSKRKRNNVLQTSAELEKAIHQASVMVIVNGSIFFVCYSIFEVVEIIDLTSSVFHIQLLDIDNSVMFQCITSSIFMINASINPFIYFIVSQRYRHAFLTTLKNICK